MKSRLLYPCIVKKEDGIFYANFLDFEGCFTDGETLEEVVINAKDVLSGTLFTMAKHNIPFPSSENKKINFEDALYTHNHPKNSNHEWGFSNDDFSSFTNLKLKYLAAIDEKYIHELCSEIYDVKKHLERVEIYIKNPNELLKLNDEERNRILQLYFASEKNLRYRRFNHGY